MEMKMMIRTPIGEMQNFLRHRVPLDPQNNLPLSQIMIQVDLEGQFLEKENLETFLWCLGQIFVINDEK